MYLHGDGGSRIYSADALDKDLLSPEGQDGELTDDQTELPGTSSKVAEVSDVC